MEAESVVKFQSTNFLWSSAHDVLFSREILASEPYRYKLRSPERGRAWEQIAQNLNSIKEPKFRVTPRSVRDRYIFLTTKKVNQLKHEERASGIAVIQTELDILLEEILEKEKEAKVQLELGIGEKKKQVEKEKISAEDMRQQAMERMSQTSKRKEGEKEDSSTVKKKKNRKSSSELFEYFEEKLSKGYAFKQEKLAKQMKEQEAIDKRERERNERQDKAAQRQNDIMVAMMNQQQQQQQQLQNLQAMFLNQQQQQTQALLAILEKTVKK